MQKPTLRQNGKKEITLKIDFHFALKDLAKIAIRACHGSREYLPETQKKFEEKIRYYLYCYGCINESFEYAENEMEEFMNDIKQRAKQSFASRLTTICAYGTAPNYEWE